jgi:hypothetical protein
MSKTTVDQLPLGSDTVSAYGAGAFPNWALSATVTTVGLVRGTLTGASRETGLAVVVNSGDPAPDCAPAAGAAFAPGALAPTAMSLL